MATFAVASPIATMSVIRRSGRIRKDMMIPRTKNPIAPATGKVQFPVASTKPNTMGEMIPAIAEAALSMPLAVDLPPAHSLYGEDQNLSGSGSMRRHRHKIFLQLGDKQSRLAQRASGNFPMDW